ncbi:hypothetical protein N7490_001349 [Penicillium lividum]|nr:hypothetical protein N7490_001349 [Penicillium lividum]
MDTDNHKNLERLARVRENQRNSRARKQEYVRELEQRLAGYKEQTQKKDLEHRLAIQKVESENRNLRTLLGSLGVSADLIQHGVDAQASSPPSTSEILPSKDQPLSQPEESTPSLCCPAGQTASDRWSSEEDVLNTTLCAIAEDLIVQYNTRGTDIEELRQRLWSGFTKGRPGDGCRVQNNILFQVLDEISNGI